MTIEWNKPTDAVSYVVRRRAYNSDTYEDVHTINDSDTTSWTDNNLDPGCQYYYYIHAKCEHEGITYTCNSESSNNYTLMNAANVSAGGPTSMNVSWETTLGDKIIHYDIQRSLDNVDANYSVIATVDGNTNAYVDTNLSPNTKYYYRIIAMSDNYCTQTLTNSACTATDTETPIITNAYISDIDQNGFTINCYIQDNVNTSGVWVNTLMPNNEWKNIWVPAGNGSFAYRINAEEYAGAGIYEVSIWVYDNDENASPYGYGAVTVTGNDTEVPAISNVYVSNLDGTGFTINCNLQDNVNVSGVWVNILMPNNEWKNVWVPAGKGSFSYRVNASEYAGQGTYEVSLWVYDYSENATPYELEAITVATTTPVPTATPTPTPAPTETPTPEPEYAYTVTDITAESGKVKVSLVNNFGEGGKLIVASFSKDGRLIGITFKDFYSATEHECSLNMNKAAYITAFVWDGFANMKPISNKKKLDL